MAAILTLTALLIPPTPASRAADPQPYDVAIAPTGNKPLDEAISGSSGLVSLRKTAPVGAFALIARAKADARRFRTALDSFGFYKGDVKVSIAGRALDDPNLPDILDAAPADPPVKVAVSIVPGVQYHLGSVAVDGTVPQAAREKLGLKSGQPAVASDVLAARSRLLDALRDQGYAMATVSEPDATLHDAQDALDVRYTATSGPRVDLGPIQITGLKRVNEAFVRNRLLIHQGDQFSPPAIEKARQDLASIGVFRSVRAIPATTLDADGELPLTFAVSERKRHVVSFGAAYSTDLGVGVTASWSDRNVFGNAEQLNLTAGAQDGGTAQRAPGYNANIQFIKPDFLMRDQQLQADLGAVKQSLQSYEQTAVLADALLNRKFSDRWSGSAGLSFEQEQITQQFVTRDYTLLGLPVSARYDSTNNLFEPTEGIRAAASVTPTESLGAHGATFVITQVNGSTYVDLARFSLTAPGRSILAFRGLVGDAFGASQFQLPPDKRFYAGGSATVRGYRYQTVGPLFPFDNNPQGGTSVAAATVEYRQRILESFGAAAFLDAGQVSADGAPGTGTWRLGAGVGARYYTSIGPIRADIAFPLNPQPGGDALEFYIGIGEAF